MRPGHDLPFVPPGARGLPAAIDGTRPAKGWPGLGVDLGVMTRTRDWNNNPAPRRTRRRFANREERS